MADSKKVLEIIRAIGLKMEAEKGISQSWTSRLETATMALIWRGDLQRWRESFLTWRERI